jgi:His-Xaa-Ser repeat protein HxsA
MLKILGVAGSALSGLHGAGHDADSQAAVARWTGVAQQDTPYTVTLTAPLNMGVDNMYAGHRSHSSHSSHSSHYSSSGGSYRAPSPPPAPYVPAQTYTPPSTPSLAPSRRSRTSSPRSSGSGSYVTPDTNTLTATPELSPYANSPNSSSYPNEPQTLAPSRATADQLTLMIMRVQAALLSKGYDPGAIDGVMNQETRATLLAYQISHGLNRTGTMTTETLNSLGVSIPRQP